MLTWIIDVVQWLFLTVPLNNNKNCPNNGNHENNFTSWLPLWRTNCHLAGEGSSYNARDKTTGCKQKITQCITLPSCFCLRAYVPFLPFCFVFPFRLFALFIISTQTWNLSKVLHDRILHIKHRYIAIIFT